MVPARTAGVATTVGRATTMTLPLNTSQPLPFHLLLTALQALRVVQAARRKRKPTSLLLYIQGFNKLFLINRPGVAGAVLETPL